MSFFRIQQHVLQASHIREYPRSLADDDDNDLKIAIKQYTPLDNLVAQQGDITIIGGHANAFPKELYEPLWDELYQSLKARNRRIRNIFIADVAHQGASGIINESKLGNDPSWMDHPRDLFLMVNHFKTEIQQPIVGIGHSMGGNNIVNLSLMHPRLFTTIILLDPVIQFTPSAKTNFGPAALSSRRRDRWPSRQDAKAAFKRSKFYQTWDPRVLDLWIKYGLRDLPTYTHASKSANSSEEREVTLSTTRDQEVFTFLRPGPPSSSSPNAYPQPGLPVSLTHPDLDPDAAPSSPFYRPEATDTFRRLPHLRPPVLYLFAELSVISAEPHKSDKLAQTGVGAGGSGGVGAGRVKGITMKRVGHLIPMEAVRETAEHSVEWTVAQVEKREADMELIKQDREKTPRQQRGQISPTYFQVLNADWLERTQASDGKASKL